MCYMPASLVIDLYKKNNNELSTYIDPIDFLVKQVCDYISQVTMCSNYIETVLDKELYIKDGKFNLIGVKVPVSGSLVIVSEAKTKIIEILNDMEWEVTSYVHYKDEIIFNLHSRVEAFSY